MTKPVSTPDARDSAERITISTLPMSGEAVTGQRASHASMVSLPATWLDRMVLLASELPIDEGASAVARATCDTLAALLPDHAVGVRIDAAGEEAAVLVSLIPVGEETRAKDDGHRLFGGYAFERTIDVGEGATFHVASDDGACEDDKSTTAGIASRAAMILRNGLRVSRALARGAATAVELRAMHEHMAQADKLASLGQIAAGVVHELNNPLTSIIAYADHLLRRANARGQAVDPDEIERLRRIQESAARMLRFTRDLVSYARPSTEAPVRVDVHFVLEQAIAFCEHVIQAGRVTVERHFGNVASVNGKPEQLAQVFVNLLTNACHAMPPEGGRIVLTTEEAGEDVIVAVQDDGSGIMPEHLTHVFTPFFTTKVSGAGTGLGLTIVKDIIDGHQGTIRAASDVSLASHGTTFTITLPMAKR